MPDVLLNNDSKVTTPSSFLATGVGRRKEAIAQVSLFAGKGLFLINNLSAHAYLQQNPKSIKAIDSPLNHLLVEFSSHANFLQKIDIVVKVRGGGLVGQADAIKLGLSRAFSLTFKDQKQTSLTDLNSINLQPSDTSNPELTIKNTKNYRQVLKDKDCLSRDARVKERRKYGLKKARKASQYHKR
jgi:small subunit ribosomal protein S9